jgi:hypothetical protein
MVEEEVEPVVEHQLEERTRLQQVLCDLSKALSPQAIVAQKVFAINPQIAVGSSLQRSSQGRSSRPAIRSLPTG